METANHFAMWTTGNNIQIVYQSSSRLRVMVMLYMINTIIILPPKTGVNSI